MMVARCTIAPSTTPTTITRAQRIMTASRLPLGAAYGDDGRHRYFLAGAGRDTHRGVVEAQHQPVALDAAGRQPVAAVGARRHGNGEGAVGGAHDLLAGETEAVDRVGDQIAG